MRNILAYVRQQDKEKVGARLKLIRKAPDEKSARALKDDFCKEYEKSFAKAVACLEEGFKIPFSFTPLKNRTVVRFQAPIRLNGLTVKSGEGHLLSAFFRQRMLI